MLRRQQLSTQGPRRLGVAEQPRQPFPCRFRHRSSPSSRCAVCGPTVVAVDGSSGGGRCQPEAERAPLVAERVLNRRSNYLADPLGQALVVGEGTGPHRWPGLAVSRAVVGQAFLDDLEPHPVADVEGYAELLGDLGQFWCDDQLVASSAAWVPMAAHLLAFIIPDGARQEDRCAGSAREAGRGNW